MKRFNIIRKAFTISEDGIALPMALFLVLIISAMSAILSNTARQNFEIVKSAEVASETFYAAEGAVSDLIRQMSVQAQLWNDQVSLATVPSGYTEYYPGTYASTNGIPTCSGIACQRDLFPTGGGLIKNLGPLNSDGSNVDSSYSIKEQLDPDNLPTADLTLAGRSAWVQVERLDQSTPNASAVGGSLSNNLSEGGNATNIRYRITGVSLGSIKGRSGQATLVAVIEMPVS